MFYLRDLNQKNDNLLGTATERVKVIKQILVNHIQLKDTEFKTGGTEL